MSQNDPFTTPRTLPESFISEHYSQHHLMAALNIDEPTFWGLYVSGRIPRGVSLMALVGVPLVVWPMPLIDEWFRQGCQPERGAIELENHVLHSLLDACKDEGIVFPDPELN